MIDAAAVAPGRTAPATQLVRVSRVEPAMGTMFTLVAHVDRERHAAELAALDEAAAWLHEVDDRFTTYAPQSEWLSWSRGEVDLDDAHPDVRHVVDRAAELTAVTEGAFSLTADPTRGPDPAAYVKGWAIQRAAELLVAGGADHVFVNGGGDIVVTRRHEPWHIGIQDPHDPTGLIGVIDIEHGAVATSGAYERGEHVIDAATGRPATSLASATVVGPDLGLADAYSTALFAAGEAGLAWFARVDDYGAYLVRPDRTKVVAGAIRVSRTEGSGPAAA